MSISVPICSDRQDLLPAGRPEGMPNPCMWRKVAGIPRGDFVMSCVTVNVP